MSDFAVFMAGNAIQNETVKYVASKRFAVKGKPVEWEIKAIDSELDEAIRKECTKRVPIVGKRGQYNQETDTDKYIGKMCVACTVYPNLNDAELQDSYGVKSADGKYDNYYRLMKPLDFDPSKKYPVIMSAYTKTGNPLTRSPLNRNPKNL